MAYKMYYCLEICWWLQWCCDYISGEVLSLQSLPFDSLNCWCLLVCWSFSYSRKLFAISSGRLISFKRILVEGFWLSTYIIFYFEHSWVAGLMFYVISDWSDWKRKCWALHNAGSSDWAARWNIHSSFGCNWERCVVIWLCASGFS